ncbi:MAG: hypothetical protein SPJ89_09250 [Treponema sp.]|nr:hypothetical protein [Spirochaetia bacterium]MDD7459798.1 hypothetical protein [Spirochaetales bacterium]MDY5812152.1 hypothetical protein [Treponema sp.]
MKKIFLAVLITLAGVFSFAQTFPREECEACRNFWLGSGSFYHKKVGKWCVCLELSKKYGESSASFIHDGDVYKSIIIDSEHKDLLIDILENYDWKNYDDVINYCAKKFGDNFYITSGYSGVTYNIHFKD